MIQQSQWDMGMEPHHPKGTYRVLWAALSQHPCRPPSHASNHTSPPTLTPPPSPSSYEDGLSSSHRAASALEFVASDTPVEMLGRFTRLELDGPGSWVPAEVGAARGEGWGRVSLRGRVGGGGNRVCWLLAGTMLPT